MRRDVRLEADTGGRPGDGRVLVLLHGMGATREVWRPFTRVLEPEWNGRWIAPDLRGHGRSPRTTSYALADHACDVAETVRELAPDASAVSVLGHSMGGAIALALASGWFALQPCEAMGLGIKIVWTNEEKDVLRKRALSSPRAFDSTADAIAFYLKVSGLSGLIPLDSEIARAGVSADGRTLRADPLSALVGAPPMVGLIAAARQAVTFLAAGESDPMCTLGDMKAHDRDAKLITGAAHNAMVEAPEQVWTWVKECIG